MRHLAPREAAALPVHPACAAFPLMSMEEMEGLVKDIGRQGQLLPVVVLDGVLVDGRHRIEACGDLGIDVRVVDYDGGPDVARWVIGKNTRRNLNSSQLSVVAARMLKVFAAEAKERQGSAQLCAEVGGRKASEDAAKAVGGVSPRSVESAKAVLEKGAPELVAAVESGAVKVSLAAEVAKLSPDEQLEVLKDLDPKVVTKALKARKEAASAKRKVAKRAKDAARIEAARAAAPGVEGIEIRHCGNEELLASLSDGAAGFVVADPNWEYDNNQNGGAAKQYVLSPFEVILSTLDGAWDKAGDDCYLLVWCTFPMLFDFLVAVHDAELGFRWKYITGMAWGKRVNEGDRKGAGYHVRGDAELGLLFKKGAPRPMDGHNYLSNWHASERTTAHSEKPVGWLVEAVQSWCPEGGLVVELWAGLAPTARACAATGRRCVSAEIDEERHGLAVAALVESQEAR